ncbi:MAG: DUF1624 domain-containing protein [Methylocystis sp.]|nr:DUF1624 domain-containing protein [Methylocystis sp.]
MNAGGRLLWLDAARGAAVVAMVIFHLIWDLSHFGYIEPRIPWSAPMKAFGHTIAFSFLFIAGYSLALAHRDHIRWPAFWRRLAIVAFAAALVSAGTFAVFPASYVFFGILHVIAAASLIALPCLSAPWFVAAFEGAIILALPLIFTSTIFDADWLMWLGLGAHEPITQDWRPLFPWAGALLMGVAAAKLPFPVYGERAGVGGEGFLAFLGRHSLIIYLAHQPALFALFTALAFIAPQADETAAFQQACEKQCVNEGGAEQTCHAICICAAKEADRSNALADAKNDQERARRINEIAQGCVGNR